MAKTKTSSTVKNRYNAKAYDQLPIRVHKGKKEEIQTHAAANGESLNAFVNRAIDEAMERDNSKQK
jgi:predicted HicB family RNase H-like nuclease